jgi:hypothetical protein
VSKESALQFDTEHLRPPKVQTKGNLASFESGKIRSSAPVNDPLQFIAADCFSLLYAEAR